MDPNLTQAEGQVFGIGAKIFTIAGPVILYGKPHSLALTRQRASGF